MKKLRICLLGGTGFVGRRLAARLNRDGHSLIVPVRNMESAHKLGVLPSVQVVPADVHDPAALTKLLSGCEAVVNLVGILNEKGRNGSGFRHAHTELAEKILAACNATDTRRFLQMSSLRADAKEGPSHYLRSKGEAEDRIRSTENAIDWTIFQPSVIFGAEDSFINRFAGLMKLAPVLPLARPNARFAPVYVDDVVAVFAAALNDPTTIGQTYQLCGPKVYSLRELVQYIRKITKPGGVTIGLPDGISRIQARILELIPGKPFSIDNYRSLTVNSICDQNGFSHFGIQPRSLESIAPGFLGGEDKNTRLSLYRREAGRTD